ncbi:MAG: hypothetical protein WC703_09180 [Candidatus Neomarinimicrobiota bacterium]
MNSTENISRKIQDSAELKKKLTIFAEKLKNELGADVCFCEIFGNRWSYVAGNQAIDFPQRRIRLNDKIGLIVSENFWNDESIVSLIKSFQ